MMSVTRQPSRGFAARDGLAGRTGSPRPLRLLAAGFLLLLPVLALSQAKAPAAPEAPARAERHSLLPLAQPLWSELSAFQRATLAPLESQWNTLPLAKKRSWLTLTEKMPAMNAVDRAKAQTRIREWASLSPEQRRMARDNYRLAKSLDRDERLATWQSYREMTPEQRSVLRVDGWTSNTAARHGGASTGLAKEAARPIAAATRPLAPGAANGGKGARPSAKPTSHGVSDPVRSAD